MNGVDCCEVSKRFGGGGHAGAAGFVIDVSSDQFKDSLENRKTYFNTINKVMF